MSESNMKSYYCHECGKNSVSEKTDVACEQCGSGFVELIEAEESHTVGGGASLAAANTPFSSTAMPTGGNSTSTSSAGSTTSTTTSTTASATQATPTASGSRAPINITIGANPIFRRGGGGHELFNAFASGNVSLDGRESPMDTEEDPGDEVLNAAQLRRRTASQVRSSGRDPSIGIFPGGMFMVSQTGGPRRQSIGQMIHQHIDNALAQRDQTDGESEGQQQSQPQQQQPRQPQQPQARAQPPSGGGATGGGHGRSNIRVINFPVMMTSRGLVGSQQQDGGSGPSPSAQQQPSTSQAAGSANPQLPQFGMPMFFGLGPQLGPMLGLHGSPSDYAWGPQGLENIISQMLANLEDNGPPPTKKEKLDLLPTVQATEEDLKECTLCSVCKEDFSLGESLLKLPCSHLYHKDCVLPWLEMHDTCPTCRFHINTGKYDDDSRTN